MLRALFLAHIDQQDGNAVAENSVHSQSRGSKLSGDQLFKASISSIGSCGVASSLKRAGGSGAAVISGRSPRLSLSNLNGLALNERHFADATPRNLVKWQAITRVASKRKAYCGMRLVFCRPLLCDNPSP